MNMKKSLALTLTISTLLTTVGCTKTELTPQVESTKYTAYGRYYTDGSVITNVGNDALLWEYSTDTISGQTPYDGMPVWIGFDDNGTPDTLKDDIIIGLVYDRNTAIYDDLEDILSEEFELESIENNIHINGGNN